MSGFRPPMRFRRIVEAVCAADREYFEAHPAEAFYFRDFIPGEMWPLVYPQNSVTLVRRLHSGDSSARARSVIPGHRLQEIEMLRADPRVTLFAPAIGGGPLEALE
jgi:hypothetical protein